jgi:hypothetical protein
MYSPTHYYVRVSRAETFTGRSLASQAGALSSQEPCLTGRSLFFTGRSLASQAGALFHRPEPCFMGKTCGGAGCSRRSG